MANRHHWTLEQAQALFAKPFLELMFEAQQVHRQHFDPRQVQVSTLLSIKTGACPEDCKYCPQRALHGKTRTIAICRTLSKWCRASKTWGWKPV